MRCNTRVPARCGDGVAHDLNETQGYEACDDGNLDEEDGCASTCHPGCGDGVIQSDEVSMTAIRDNNSRAD